MREDDFDVGKLCDVFHDGFRLIYAAHGTALSDVQLPLDREPRPPTFSIQNLQRQVDLVVACRLEARASRILSARPEST